MKIGCFLKTVFAFVLIAAAFYYLYETHGSEILNSANEKVKREIVRQINENLTKKISSAAQDSVKSQVGKIKEWFQKQGDKLKLEDLKKFSNDISDILNEKVVNSEVIKKITKEIKNFEKSATN